ncbi:MULTISPECIES: response regulator [unclassified Rhodosalinus]|uniref:response regulator n=1 Tax=unclassified Rhodosalinus TaxID=2630183 RepID=UPI00352345C1
MTRTVLTVDDSKSVRDMVAFTLGQKGFRVVGAADGAEGLSAFTSQKIDLVITDLNMPNMNGFEFIEQARGSAANAGVPIVMLSTESDPAAKSRGKALGATGWINKPFDADMLTAVVNKLLG